MLETLTVVAELADLKANPNRYAYGSVVEGKLDKGRGPVATLLVENGTLRAGRSNCSWNIIWTCSSNA